MKRLDRQLLNDGFESPVPVGTLNDLPEKVIQFGEGNFLRAFVDWMIGDANSQGIFNGSVLVVQPITYGRINQVIKQDGLFTLYLRGIEAGSIIEQKQVVTSISRGLNPYEEWDAYLQSAAQPEMRIMISNTTEAGIDYVAEGQPNDSCPTSFPAKVTAWLYERYKAFEGDASKGMIIIPCELIEDNGDKLKAIVKRYTREWGLGEGFSAWLNDSNYFLNTLVDRIVTGYPADEMEDITAFLGYKDELVDTGEIFHLWVIEGPSELSDEFPLHAAGKNVLWTDDITPYRTRKVRILNGAHTMMVPSAYLYGLEAVKESVEHDVVGAYLQKGLYEEVIPVVPLPEDEKMAFARSVIERFRNPYIHHLLISITLNSISKFKVRVLPSLLDYYSLKGELPDVLTFSMAGLITFYKGTTMNAESMEGMRDGEAYPIRDDMAVLEYFYKLWQDFDGDIASLVKDVLGKVDFWDQDLNDICGMTDKVTVYLKDILTDGIKEAMKKVAGI